MAPISSARTLVAGGSGDGGDGGSYLLLRPDRGLYAVASPIGPTGRGATFALEAIAANMPLQLEGDGAEDVRRAMRDAEARWQDVVEADPSCRGLGACLALAAVQPAGVVVGHLGDCGVLHLRGREIVGRTTDHTIPAMQSTLHPANQSIGRGFGMSSEPEVQVWPTEKGDCVLLTSEVRTRVSDDEIAAIAADSVSLRKLVRVLLDLANDRGATGEISVVVFVVR